MKGREEQLWVFLRGPGLHLRAKRNLAGTGRQRERSARVVVLGVGGSWKQSIPARLCSGRGWEVRGGPPTPGHPASGSPALGLWPDCHASPPRGASASWAWAWAGEGFPVTHAALARGWCRGRVGSGHSPVSERVSAERGEPPRGAGSPCARRGERVQYKASVYGSPGRC